VLGLRVRARRSLESSLAETGVAQGDTCFRLIIPVESCSRLPADKQIVAAVNNVFEWQQRTRRVLRLRFARTLSGMT
jgi:hypothetical protein